MKRANFFDAVYPEPNTGCWIWIGSQVPFGHGTVNANTHSGFKYAHRYSYFLEHGDFDRSLQVLHKCDKPWCVNPQHLYLGTTQDNHRDMIERSNPKYAHGDQIHTCKLNPDSVRQIRNEFQTGKLSMRFLGRKYGVDHHTISNVLSRKRWAHVL